MKFARFVCLFILFAVAAVLAQTNPVPFVNQPLVPTAVAPGGPGFTLTVNGTGFVSTSTINWNGTPLTTAFVSSSQLTATVPASNIAKASTASITVSSPSPGGGISNLQFFSVTAPTSLQFTGVPVAPDTACQPCLNFIAADFNRDGKLDLTFDTSYEFPSGFTSLGNGDGTFQAPLSSGEGFDFSVAADFNGDGKLDMAGIVQNVTIQPYQAYIAMGNGDGTFSVGSTIAGGNQSDLSASQIVAADFNRDGKLDVAIGDDLGLEVYLGNGDGTFQSGLPPVGVVGAAAQTVGDFNADGMLDIAEVGGTNPELQILLGNGDGTFKTGASYPGFGSVIQILAADLNGDDNLDLVILQATPSSVTVLLGNGDGTFGAATNYLISGSLAGGALADFNADGKLDVMLSTTAYPYTVPSTTILLGNGDGTFQSPLVLPILANGSVAAGDFNNDGKLDLAVATGTSSVNGVFVLLQDVSQTSLSPSSLTFGDQAVNTTSPAQKVTLTNNGTGPLTISSIGITGADPTDFSQTNNCPASLAVGANCQISVTFTPTALGARSASLTVTDNATGSPQSIPLSGTGAQPVVQFNPTSVSFSAQTVGGTTSPQVVALTNKGGSALTISAVGITGANAGDFADTSACGTTVEAGASCQIKVTFTPTASGARSAALSISDNAPGSPQSVALSGTGQDFSLAPKGSSTATVAPGQTATYTVVVTPAGGFNQTVDLSCSGAPAQSTCTVSSSVTLDGVNPSTATVSVVTTASAMGLTQPVSAPPFSGAVGLWLGVSGILGLCVLATLRGGGHAGRPQLMWGVTLVCFLAMGITITACGGGGGSGGGGGGTQAGTYTLTMTGTSSASKLANKTNLTLIVQ